MRVRAACLSCIVFISKISAESVRKAKLYSLRPNVPGTMSTGHPEQTKCTRVPWAYSYDTDSVVQTSGVKLSYQACIN